MLRNIIYLSIALFANGCWGYQKYDPDRYTNSDKYDSIVIKHHEELGKKYGFAEYVFDVECIYGKDDLTKLVTEMLAIGGSKPESVRDGLDNDKKQYFSIMKIGDSTYEFRTSSLGDYVDLELIMPSLHQVVKKTNPSFEYNFSNRDGGQVAYMIFANSANLVKAVDEGYPCSLPSGQWKLDEPWPFGVYSKVKLDKIPDYEELRIKYHQTLTELYDKGFDVPSLTLARISMIDPFKENEIDIMIDGAPLATSFNEISGKTVRCFWDSWGVLLAYTLIKHYNGAAELHDKENKETMPVSAEAYYQMAEKAFGRRK